MTGVHEDFGEKIGGAKKDLWKDRGLYADDLETMNEREAEKFVKKDNVWKKPDYAAMLEEGIPLGVVYFIKKARDGLNASPQYYRTDDTPEKRIERQKEYIETVRELQTVLSDVRTVEDAAKAYDRFFVDNPVTQTDNNEYYLNHLYDGTYNKVGCLFADYENRADFSDRNTIIYGHNMRDGSMFALLNRYDEQSYFDAHRQMYLVTPKGGYVMEIFAAFAAKPEESGSETSPWQLSWKDDGAYTTWLTAMKERSAVESDVTVTCSDKVLTLSTCTPGGTGRFLVMGKLVKVDNEI